MSSRDSILAAIRTAAVPPAAPAVVTITPAPGTHGLEEQFLRVLAAVGGAGLVRSPDEAVADLLAQRFGGERDDVLIIPGRFAVAENGAVYVDTEDLAERSDVVRTEHLVLLVPSGAIVATMHEAVRAMPSGSCCGWFLSGPSKTADIEQSLVIGAQGARTLHVIFEPR